jgi:putative transposase
MLQKRNFYSAEFRNFITVPDRRVWSQISAEHRQAILDLSLKHPELSSREIAVKFTDDRRYFISESSVYRILKAQGLITTPAYPLQLAKDEFQDKTTRINQMWQTDFTYCRVIGWGIYYLSTIMNDYSRKIIAWQLCSSMTAEDVKSTIDLATINIDHQYRHEGQDYCSPAQATER